MALIDDSGHRIKDLPARPKPRTTTKTKSSSSGERYAKPKAMAGLPKWAQEIRNNSNFMPLKVKPASYTALARAEASRGYVYRPQVFASPTQTTPQTTQMTLGKYFPPTEAVASGVKKQYNLWQDIKNLGGKIVHKGGSLLMGALDVLSRPRYALMNMYNDSLQRHYTTADSAGGSDVTGFEAFKGILGLLNPVAAVADLATGTLDDKLKAGWQGLSGVKKTGMHDILNTTNPEFLKDHPLGSNIASIVGDFVFDPVTWLTMGVNPGSITKAGISGGKLAFGDRLAASRLWNETLFTAEGRAAGVKTVASDIKMKEVNRLNRAARRTGKKLTKAQAGKKTRLTEQALQAKRAEIAKKLVAKKAEDLQGSQLAWKILKKSLPTLGLTTVSRLNTGAGASTALRGAALLKEAHHEFHLGVAEQLKSEDRWHAAFVANQGKDFEYTHAGQKYTVKLSEAKNVKDFIYKVSGEANPISAYAEHGTVAARARGGNIKGVEARGYDFMQQFKLKFEDEVTAALGPKAAGEFDKIRGFSEARSLLKDKSEIATEAEEQNPALLHLGEDALDDPKLTYDSLKKQAQDKWKAAHPDQAFPEGKINVLYTDVNGKVKKVHLSTLKQAAEHHEGARARRMAAKQDAAKRDPSVRSVDKLVGRSDGVAAARDAFNRIADDIKAGREKLAEHYEGGVLHGQGELHQKVQQWHQKISKFVDESNEFTDAEKAKYKAILQDTSIPVEERFAKIVKDKNLSNEEVVDLLDEAFNITIDNAGIIHIPKGGTLDDIPKLVQSVLYHRFKHRVTASMQEKSGVGLEGEVGNGLRITQKAVNSDNINHARDVNGELGMMILDGYRAAINYAIDNDLYKDPEALFDVLHTTASEFMDMAAADTKSQVFQLMFNMTGMRLPEKFVPTFGDVAATVGPRRNFLFKKMKNGEEFELENQDLPWQNLAINMQNWAWESFKGFIEPRRYVDRAGEPLGAKDGWDVTYLGRQLLNRAGSVDSLAAKVNEANIEKYTVVDDAVLAVADLRQLVNDVAFNGETFATNKYNMLDFLMYHESIIKGQTTSVRTVKPITGEGTFRRIEAGRLSALDSFTFLSPEAIKGLESIRTLKKLTKSPNAETAEYAQAWLSKLFVDNGGIAHLQDINQTRDAAGRLHSLGNSNFEPAFKTLGIHAKLKETSLRTGSALGSGHAAQLLENMWGVATVNHELQKAFQSQILHKVWVKGQSEEFAARELAANADKFFEPYENLKKILYPHRKVTSEVERGAQETFGNNPLELPRDTVNPNELAPNSGLSSDLHYTGEAAPRQAGKYQADINELNAIETAGKEARARLENSIAAVKKARSGGADDPELVKELEEARAAYIEAKRKAEASAINNDAEVSVGPDGKPAQVAPRTSADTNPDGTFNEAPELEDSADFGNVTDAQYTDEELAQIKKYIGVAYDEADPRVIAQQMHTYSNSLAGDILIAQQDMKSKLMDMSIKYGANARFMGIPFMPVGTPQNATKTVAGVVAYEQQKGNVAKFFHETVTKFRSSERGEKMYKNFSRPSTLFEGSLERMRMQVVNYAGMARKKVIDALDEFYDTALKSEYSNTHINGLGRKEKLQYFKDALFKPTPTGMPDRLNEFKLADGTNPVDTIAANFHENARAIFTAQSTTGQYDEIKNFNRMMVKKYRLNDATLGAIQLKMNIDPSFEKLMPYSREWLQEIGKIGGVDSKNALHIDKLLKSNLGEFHYAMQDAKLKYQAGRALNHGVFEQFAFRMDPETVEMYNKQVVPSTIAANGKPLRGPMVKVDADTIGPLSQWGINAKHIPQDFQTGEFYITTDLLPEIRTMFDYIDEMSELNDTITTGFLNKVLGYFKASVTIYKIPTYPVRNLIGDVFMSAFDGLTNPRYYKDAASLVNDFSEAMKKVDIKDYENVFDGGFLKAEQLKAAHDPASVLQPGQVPATPFRLHLETEGGPVDMNGAQVMESFHLLGLGQNRVAGEISESLAGARQTNISVLGGKIHDALRNVNDVREDWTRIAHYLYALEREAPLGGTFEEISRRAAIRVTKHHFDYNDVSLMERKILAPWLPFYKWTRNIIPYTIATMVSKPYALKAESAVNQIAGFLVDDDKDDNRTDFVIPEWITHDSAVPIGSFTDPNNNQFGQYMSLSMPLSDTLKRTLGPMFEPFMEESNSVGGKALGGGAGAISVGMAMLNPIAKGLIQAPTGQELWPTGGAPEKGNWAQTMASAIPGSGALDQLFSAKKGVTGIGDQNKAAYWLDQLGAINLSNNTERAQLGELKQREDFYRAQLNNRKGDLMNLIAQKYPSSTPQQRQDLVDAILKQSRKEDPARAR